MRTRQLAAVLSVAALAVLLPAACNNGEEVGPGTDAGRDGAVGSDAGADGSPDVHKPDDDSSTPCNEQCDCEQGQRCSTNRCGPPPPGGGPGFCCDKPGCPAGRGCLHWGETPGVCPGTATCSHLCDCEQNHFCRDGYCFTYEEPPYPDTTVHYCCDKPGCPSGEPCEHANGTADTCP
jgi:hypothetical protein